MDDKPTMPDSCWRCNLELHRRIWRKSTDLCGRCQGDLLKKITRNNKRARDKGHEATLTIVQWAKILRDSQGHCCYCHEYYGFQSLILEHVTPISKGGGTTVQNMVAACGYCNGAKGTKDADKWKPRESRPLQENEITKTPENNQSFRGFARPVQNYFPMPNIWTDICADITSLAELKIIQYVLRHTWGFQEFDSTPKAITTDEFLHGRKRRDDSRIDNGTGLKSNKSVIEGVKAAIKDGYLIEIVDNSDMARVVKSYALKMDKEGENTENQVCKVYTPGVQTLHTHRVDSTHRSEKETKERNNRKKDTTQLPSGNRCSDSSSFSFGSEQGTNEPPPQEKKPRGRQLSALEHKVADAFDALLICPINREDSAVKKSLKYLAGCITAGKATLADVKRVKDKLEENPFWQGKVTIQALEKQFSTQLTALAITPPADTLASEVSEEEQMVAWIRSQSSVSGPVTAEEVLA